MTWVRLDDGFADHPKIERVGPLAAWLHVVAICYSSRHLTDGQIPKTKARRLADIPQAPKHITALIEAGLWHDEGDHYQLHDYLDYQASRVEVEADRERQRERKRRQRQTGMSTRSPTGTFAGTTGGTTTGNPPSSPTVPIPSLPVEPKGGGNSRPPPDNAPPNPKCPAHSHIEGPVPPCGACADARRSYETWRLQHTPTATNGAEDPRQAMQIAARKRAETGTKTVHEIVAEPADPDAAKHAAELRQRHRLTTRKDLA